MERTFYKRIDAIFKKDDRYKPDAYEFVMQALAFTQKKLKRQGHVTARELLEGIRTYGRDLYGPMARTVFSHWGITATQDFGQIVFNMVSDGLMGKNDEDTPDQFRDVYDFESAFDIFNAERA